MLFMDVVGHWLTAEDFQAGWIKAVVSSATDSCHRLKHVMGKCQRDRQMDAKAINIIHPTFQTGV